MKTKEIITSSLSTLVGAGLLTFGAPLALLPQDIEMTNYMSAVHTWAGLLSGVVGFFLLFILWAHYDIKNVK